MTDLPTREWFFYVIEMVESSLIDFSYVNPWADHHIMQMDLPPAWLCDLSTQKYQGALAKTLHSYVYDDPIMPTPPDLEKFHAACIWLRYERGELSWATTLNNIGRHLDAVCADWDCETPYYYLNMHEDAYFSEDSEENTKEMYLTDQDLRPFIEQARDCLESFFKHRLPNKAIQSDASGAADL